MRAYLCFQVIDRPKKRKVNGEEEKNQGKSRDKGERDGEQLKGGERGGDRRHGEG